MIPYILIIGGAIAVIYGLIGLVRIAFLPLVRAHQVVFKRKDDYLFYENPAGQRVLKSQIKFLLNIYIAALIVGSLLIAVGFYSGFTDHGVDFWLYKVMFHPQKEQQDRITEDGKYRASDGNEYNYYIMIQGSKIYFKDELYSDHSELEEKIKGFDRSNTIVIHDDYAVSSEYHYVIDLLTQSGIKYIEESN